MTEQYPGCPDPLGALLEPDGVNFSVYSRSADRLELLLYDDIDPDQPAPLISLPPERRLPPGTQRPARLQERGCRRLVLRLGRRHPPPPSIRRDGHLRDARRWIHQASQFGCRSRETRDLCRADRQDPLPARPRHHCGGVAARFPVRLAGRSRRADQLLGLLPPFVLRSALRLQLMSRSPSPPP